jgi:hypothetical protein
LDTLMRLHAARWGAGAFEGTAGAFHRDFAHRALDAGWLRLWLMEVDGRPVAAWYGFRFGGVDAFYQSGRDQSWDRYSVGSQLLVHDPFRLRRRHQPLCLPAWRRAIQGPVRELRRRARDPRPWAEPALLRLGSRRHGGDRPRARRPPFPRAPGRLTLESVPSADHRSRGLTRR